jgi:4-hydroxy-2-oxoheptanedioate aldolase
MQQDPQPNQLKQAMRAQRRQVGFWLTLASPTATEIAAGAGFDWLLIDMEHSSNELPDIVHHLRAAASGGSAEPVVRVPSVDPVLVKRLLDCGARSIMFPNVQTAQEASIAVAATRYPPLGMRGYAGGSRATAYGRVAGYAAKASEELCVIVQVETPTALEAIAEIGAVDGVDCVFIGPNDLAANMGFLGRADVAPVKQAILAGLERIRATGKYAGLLNYDEGDAMRMFEAGFGMIAVGGDTSTLARGAERIARSFAG